MSGDGEMRRKGIGAAFFIWLLWMACGCGEPEAGLDAKARTEAADAGQEKKAQTRDQTVGPVHAEVLLDDSNPLLGEAITLTLTVDAAPDVAVTMPEFGDQMGRFNIADYQSTQGVREDGRTVYMQRYTLDLPMSGKLLSPSFLVEFTDNRESSERKGGIQELLTEEIPIDVRSVFSGEEGEGTLAPEIGALPELEIAQRGGRGWWIWVVAGICVAGLSGAVVYAMRRGGGTVIPAPDVVALEALGRLEKRELPNDQKTADAWYVELSSIVRRYVEGRFSLHAPRLTTEEFLERAKGSHQLSEENKRLIYRLLERSDRVKFTDFVPSAQETSQMLADARLFIETTRISEENAKDNGNA